MCFELPECTKKEREKKEMKRQVHENEAWITFKKNVT
jgi:hypothetical protein